MKTPAFPLMGLLGLIFVTLKLTGHIDWSWWWVTLPFWGGIALFLVLGGAFFLLAMILAGLSGLFNSRRRRRRY